MKHNIRTQQHGFTLIELIMVIVILGILSAFALPRFADLGGEARAASVTGLAGALKSAANIAHAQQLASGLGGGGTVSLEGQDVTMVAGYPTADSAGITEAAQVSAGTQANFDAGSVDYVVDAGAATGGSTLTYTLQTNCSVTYTASTADTDGKITAAYNVATTVTGC